MGKAKLFLRLFLQNQRRIYAYVLTLLPNRADADDLFQEASLVLWDKFDESAPPDDFAAWGCRIAYFKVLDFCKKHQRRRVLFSQALLERVAETALEQSAALQLDERREALADCLGKLNDRYRYHNNNGTNTHGGWGIFALGSPHAQNGHNLFSGSTAIPFNMVIPNPASETRHLIGFSSKHSGGVMFVFLDGSVRFASDATSDEIRKALGTRNGEESVNLSD
jgi:RNA polymerase sigma factor (sigma-70 family)